MKLPKPLRNALPIVFSVALLALAFPPANVSLLVFVALAPWLATLRDTDGKGALRSGYLFGLLFFLHQMYWLMPFVGRWTGSYLLAALPWLIAAFLAGFFYMAAGWLIHRCWVADRPWAIPLVWAGVEALRAYIPGLAYPWGTIALPLWNLPAFIQHAAWGTIFLVSAWVVAPSVLLAMFVWPQKDRTTPYRGKPLLRLGALFLALLVMSPVRYATPPAATKRVVTVGQPGVDQAFSRGPEERAALNLAGQSIAASAIAQGADLLVLPEGFAEGGPDLPPVSPLGPNPPVPVVFGGNREAGGKRFQSAYGYDGRWSVADKTRLVVFGEFVPLRGVLPLLDRFNLPSGDLTPSKEVKTLTVNGIAVGSMLCFEGLFPDLAEKHCALGAQLLAVMAIDDWYEGTPAPAQLMANSIWRSVESGLPVVRAASRGVSLATDARGNVLAMAPTGREVAMRVELGVPERSDAFEDRFAFVWICWAACGLVALEPVLKLLRSRVGKRS